MRWLASSFYFFQCWVVCVIKKQNVLANALALGVMSVSIVCEILLVMQSNDIFSVPLARLCQ
jgi:hypothetical protein